MKEFPIYINRIRDYQIPISNMTFRDRLSIRHGILLRNLFIGPHLRKPVAGSPSRVTIGTEGSVNKRDFMNLLSTIEVTTETSEDTKLLPLIGVHESISIIPHDAGLKKAIPYSLLSEIEMMSELTGLQKTDLMKILHELIISSAAPETKMNILHASGTDLGIQSYGGAISVAHILQREDGTILIDAAPGNPGKTIAERMDAQIGIMDGKFLFLSGVDDKTLGQVDGETLKVLGVDGGFPVHEINFETARPNLSIVSSGGVVTKVFERLETAYCIVDSMRPRILREIDNLMLNEIDGEELGALDYSNEIGLTVYSVRHRFLSEMDNQRLRELDRMKMDDIDFMVL